MPPDRGDRRKHGACGKPVPLLRHEDDGIEAGSLDEIGAPDLRGRIDRSVIVEGEDRDVAVRRLQEDNQLVVFMDGPSIASMA
jgi:hypothetical protein